MNSFGLGLVLNFVDNASAGMNTATSNFNRMSATADSLTSSVSASATEMAAIAFSLSAVGDTFMSIGESIISVFTGITQSVIDTGGQMLNYRMQLTALYGSAEAGESKMEEIKQYAMSSVFAIESLIPAVTMMKAVGIEALDEITTSSGSATQKLLDYASDLAAMMPNMRNVYGTGVEAAMGAFKEYIAEGNAMSLKRGAGLDITAILGEEKGSSIAERTQQIADLIDKLNIVGYTANLAGTPTQRLSNMQDALFNSLSKIADSGVFEAYCKLLETLSDWVFSLVENEETFNAITGVLAETITALLSPLQSMLDWVVANSDAIINWIKENPKLVKNILLTVAAVGAFLIVGGSLLKMLSSISFAMAGLNVLKNIPVLIGKIVTASLPFIAVAGLAYTAWDNNLGGIQDKLTWFLNNVGDIFTILGDAWGDNTLSMENFEKAKKLGILPFISGILQLKYYWDYFVEGFKNGFKSVFEGVFKVLSSLGIDIDALGDKLGGFLKSLTEPGSEDKWTKLGEAIGSVVAGLVLLSLTVKVITPVINAIIGIGKAAKWVINIFKTIGNMKIWSSMAKGIKNVGTVLRGGQGVGVFTKLLEVFRAVASGGMRLKDALMVVFSPVAVTISGIVSLVTGVATAVVGFVKQLTDGFSWFWEVIKWIGIALGVVGAILLGVATWPAVIVGAIIGIITTIIVLIKDSWNEICNFFSKIGSWIYDNVIKPVADFFSGLWNGIVTGVTTAFNAVKNFLMSIVNWIYDNIIQPIITFVTAIYRIISKIVEIVAKVIEIIVVLFVQLCKQIYAVAIKPIVDFFVWLWDKIVSIVTSIVQGIKDVFITIVTWVDSNIIKPVSDFFSGLWNGIVTGVRNFIDSVKSVFLTIVSWIENNIINPIADFFTSLWEKIKTAFDTVVDTVTGVIKGAINTVLSFVCGLINGVIDGINWAIGIINKIPGVEISKITRLELPELATGGVVDKPTTAIIGEAGAEAVIPLENNTGWIGILAHTLAPMLNRNESSVPSTSVAGNSTVGFAPTSNNVSNSGQKDLVDKETYVDNSITFESGSVIIQVSSVIDAELEKVAEKLMKIIARKQQLRAMAVRR